MEHKTFEFSLPEGYREVYHIDAKDRKTGLKLTAAAAAIFVVLGILLFLFADLSEFDFDNMLLYDGVWLAAMIVYIVLHELVHGAVYKAMTHQKLTFGLTWSAAFCGVPDIYTYRKAALSSLVAPLTVFTLILLPLTIQLRSVDTGWYIVCGLLFALHFSGCVGDMYVTGLFLTKFKDPRTLMRDTGPAQWMYEPEE
jgi:hypothetical protein